MSNEKGWRGVFTENGLPKRVRQLESGVVNYDDHGPGTHWVCYNNSPMSVVIEFFDSYGLPPSDKIRQYLGTSGKRILYNDSQLQLFSSVMCGYYCVHYLKSRNKRRLPSEIIYLFDQHPTDFNEALIRKLFV
jgi:hypothetical protein